MIAHIPPQRPNVSVYVCDLLASHLVATTPSPLLSPHSTPLPRSICPKGPLNNHLKAKPPRANY